MTFSNDPRAITTVVTAPLQFELPLATGAIISKTGLRFETDPSLEQWEQTGDVVFGMETMARWSKLDYLKIGERCFGKSRVEESLKARGILQLEITEVLKLEPIVERRADLTPEHHLCVARLDEVDQKRWLETARVHDLTPRDLRASIRAGFVERVSDPSANGNGSGTSHQARTTGTETPHAIAADFARWHTRAASQIQLFGVEQWREMIELFEPIGRFLDQARAQVAKAESKQP